MNQVVKKNPQETDIKFPNPPSDSISSISVNGNGANQNTNMLIATSWDNTVLTIPISMIFIVIIFPKGHML